MTSGSKKLATISAIAIVACGAMFAVKIVDQSNGSPLDSSCSYTVQEKGVLASPPGSLFDVKLLEPESDVVVRHGPETGPIADESMPGRGMISRSSGRIYQSEGISSLLSTYSTGGKDGRRVVSMITVKNPPNTVLPKPSYVLVSKKQQDGCPSKVTVIAEDPSAISRSAILHSQLCDADSVPLCGFETLPMPSLTCRMRSSYPKGKALYQYTQSGKTKGMLVDWTAMTNWRMDPSTYVPYKNKSCGTPFTN